MTNAQQFLKKTRDEIKSNPWSTELFGLLVDAVNPSARIGEPQEILVLHAMAAAAKQKTVSESRLTVLQIATYINSCRK